MDLFTPVLLVVLLCINIALIVMLVRGSGKNEGGSALLLQQQLQELSRTLDTRLSESTRHVQKALQTQLSESASLIREVTTGLTKLDETNRQVISFADELQNLQDILQNPKQRGVLGEYFLETVLKNVLPPGRFEMQYAFTDGEVVDAVVFLDRGKILPVDSKFSLENYNRILEARDPVERERLEKLFKSDLKNRIDETSKYIRPTENTMDFAFMFIPSEGIYYDLLVNQVGAVKSSTRDLLEYAFRDKKVIVVSPTSFLAYLQTVLQGLRALEIEEGAKEIRKNVEQLGRHLRVYADFHAKLGASLATTVNHYNATGKEFLKIDKDVLRITATSPELAHELVDRPLPPGE
ncbi:MAG: DNA recombination protein RmuC [Candidatus Pacebacteria bacterium]|nr:DNA recombination protein RmuC [Candidatus Paceibacterota bacterium]